MTFGPSIAISTGLFGRLRQMSASSRPETRARPSSTDVGVQRGPGRGLVVEGGQLQALAAVGQRTGLDQQPGEHGCARADGQGAGRPGDGIGEDVTFDAELHDWCLLAGGCGWRPGCSSGWSDPATERHESAVRLSPGRGRSRCCRVDERLRIRRSSRRGGSCGEPSFAQVSDGFGVHRACGRGAQTTPPCGAPGAGVRGRAPAASTGRITADSSCTWFHSRESGVRAQALRPASPAA